MFKLWFSFSIKCHEVYFYRMLSPEEVFQKVATCTQRRVAGKGTKTAKGKGR